MYGDNGVLVDLDEIKQLVASADVFVVGFAGFPERLIVDSRSDHKEMPLVQVVEPSRGARERLAWLKRRRPSLGAPDDFSFFAWPHSPEYLVQSGVWQSICDRVGASYEAAVGTQCDLAIKQLFSLDHEMIMSVLKGEQTVTLWPPQPSNVEEA